MKLLQCHVENFGKLHQFTLQFENGLNVFCHENGWGKTTLITFIKTMFYGLSNYRGNDLDQNERKKYAPWQGGNFGGNLDFAVNGKTYRVTRFFGKTNAADTFTLTDLATGKPSKDYAANLGEALFDLDAASFVRTLLIPQIEVESVATAQITDRLINLIQGTDEQTHYETAAKILNDQRRALSNQAKTGQIETTQNALNANAMQIDRLRQQTLSAADLTAQIAAADRQIALLQKQQATIQQQIGAQNVLKNLPPKSNRQTKIFGGLSVACGLAFVMAALLWLCGVGGVVAIINAVVAFVGGVACLIVWLLIRKAQPVTAPQPNDLAMLQQEQDQIQRAIQAQTNAKMNAQIAAQNAQNANERLTTLQNARAELQQTLTDLQAELTAVQAAQNFLATAYDNLNTQYLQPMQDGLQKYLHILTQQDFSHVTVDTDLRLGLPAYGQTYSADYYSRGYQNLFDLCLRLALVDALFADHEPPLLIMDDPFVNLDADKTAAALDFLRTLAHDRQIVYFTCHASRC
ncbi:MAG: AAA family ATPase [Prevotella sp.]|nr:AAA family ATPase [Prevotella sp.]